MKRYFSVLLAFVMILTTGCGALENLRGVGKESQEGPFSTHAQDEVELSMQGFLQACAGVWGEIPEGITASQGVQMLRFLSMAAAYEPDAFAPFAGEDGLFHLSENQVRALWMRHMGEELPLMDAVAQGGGQAIEAGQYAFAQGTLYPVTRVHVEADEEGMTVLLPGGKALRVLLDDAGRVLLWHWAEASEEEVQNATGAPDEIAGVLASSSVEGYPADALADGDTSSMWISDQPISDLPWVQVHFARPVRINRARVTSGYDTAHGRAKTIVFRLGDGNDRHISYNEERAEWNFDFDDIVTDSIEMLFLERYPGEVYEDVSLAEVMFYYDDAPLATPEPTAEPTPEPTPTPTPAPTESPAQQESGDWDKTGFTPTWFTWEVTGYDAQDIDMPHFRAGKWVNSDGSAVLYLDYSSSPDGFEYQAYFGGEGTWDSYTYLDESGMLAYDADDVNVHRILEPGVMEFSMGGSSMYFYLVRKKYSFYD